MADSQFYLYFDEGYYDEEPRLCTRVKEVSLGPKENLALWVNIDPPCSGTRYTSDTDLCYLLLETYFVGQSFSPVTKWPMAVRVYVPLVENPELRDHISGNEVLNIAFGSIYETPKPESPALPDELRRRLRR